jgi:hypothetical protein
VRVVVCVSSCARSFPKTSLLILRPPAGNYPYPSNYLTGGGPLLPAYPVVQACNALNVTFKTNATLLAAMKIATDVYNNATLNTPCYALPDDVEQDGIWDYQYCTEMLPQVRQLCQPHTHTHPRIASVHRRRTFRWTE